MFGNRKVIENNDYFIVTYKDIDFNFDKKLFIIYYLLFFILD